MGIYIVITILFIFFIGVISLVMDSFIVKHKHNYTGDHSNHVTATVILEENYSIDFDKLND